MVFGVLYSRLNNLSLELDDTVILPSATVRNLGVTFDSNMTMTQHVTNLCQSVNWQIRNIYKIRRFIDSDTCANIVRALILSLLDYCNLLFNGITQKNLVRLQKLQNKCTRLVNMQPRSCHITPLLMDLHWLCVSERIISGAYLGGLWGPGPPGLPKGRQKERKKEKERKREGKKEEKEEKKGIRKKGRKREQERKKSISI